MRIQIETRSRWRFTLTSPNHDDVEKTIRPGAKPFASQESKSAVDNSVPNASGRSLDAYDIAEGVWPAPRLSAKVPRCRSFRKRVCQFLVHISRMHPEDKAWACYDVGDPVPPYEHRPTPELPASSSAIQELPGRPSMIPEILGQEYFELEDYTPDNYRLQDLPMHIVQDQSVPSRFEVSNKRIYPPLGYAMQQAFEPVSSPVYPPSLNTEQQLYALPGMTQGGHSHDSSPISPYTPRSEVSQGTQPYGSGFPNDTVSPHELILPATGQYAPETPVYQGIQGYPPRPTLESPLRSYSMVLPTSPTPTTANEPFSTLAYINFSSTSSSSPHNSTPYQQPSLESLSSQHSTPNPVSAGPDYEAHRLGTTWERSPSSVWVRQPIQEHGTIDLDNTHYSTKDNVPNQGHRPALAQAQQDHRVAMPANRPYNEDTNPQSREVCDQCGTGFTGRYRKGNLTRHIRERHNLRNSMVGKECRVCKQVYNRADAKRKHEWKKHRLPDAKPTKRRN